jgi:NMD protein affecting ribosome stability and mRNA decay
MAIPEMTVIADMNNYPATARCSACGQAMPTRQRWINSSADNLVWFAEQFKLHLAQQHPG